MIAHQVKNLAPGWAKEASRPVIRGYGRATQAQRPMPDFLIIGTKRGGTTTLFKYLRRHPHVMSMWPEVENAKKTFFFDQNWHRGIPWYRAHFPTQRSRDALSARVGGPVVVGESAPNYMFHPAVIDRVRATLPQVKIIVLLRNPVDRIWSHYNERVANGTEPLPFRDALDAEESRLAGLDEMLRTTPGAYSETHDFSSYKARGRYLEHLEPWIDHYYPDRLHVVRSEDMYSDPAATLTGVHRFLGIPEIAPPEAHRFNYIPTSSLDPDLRRELADYYAPHVAALEARLGRTFDWDL